MGRSLGAVRGRSSGAVWTVGAVVAAGVIVVTAVAVVGAGGAGGAPRSGQWFGEQSTPVGRQAASGTGGNNSTSDIGNAIAGSCTTRFEYDSIRLKVEVTAASQQGVTVDLTNVPGAGPTDVAPGESRTWSLDKGSGHCRFTGPVGTITVDGQREEFWTREGFTSTWCFNDCTSIVGSFARQQFTFKVGGDQFVFPYSRLMRPSDPDTRTAQIDLRVEVRKIDPPIRCFRC